MPTRKWHVEPPRRSVAIPHAVEVPGAPSPPPLLPPVCGPPPPLPPDEPPLLPLEAVLPGALLADELLHAGTARTRPATIQPARMVHPFGNRERPSSNERATA